MINKNIPPKKKLARKMLSSEERRRNIPVFNSMSWMMRRVKKAQKLYKPGIIKE